MLFLVSCAYDIDYKGGIKGNGIILKENRKVVGDFDTVVASENLKVWVSQADEFSITVEADENIITLIDTNIKDGKLYLQTHENIGRATKKVYVSLPNVSALISSTGSILQTQNIIKGDSLLIDASTGSFLNAKIYVNKVIINGKEGTKLSVSGEAHKTSIDISSGSNMDAKELQTINCLAKVSYGGSVKIKVSKSLIADANTGGNISYIGNPKVDKTKSLSGIVQEY